MGIFSQYLSPRAVHLSNGSSAGNPQGVATPKKQERIPKTLLNELYRKDFLTFNIINLPVKTLMHAGFKFQAKTEKGQKEVDTFFENIGKIGEETTKEELVEFIAQDDAMYGESFVELVYNQKETKIVDLAMIDATIIDYAKNNSGNIVLDSFGRPIGYMISLPWGSDATGRGDAIPQKYADFVSRAGNQIFLLPKRIAHFKLHCYGDRFYPVGLIEPAYSSAYRKQKIEEARTNMIYTRGENPIIASVGNENHEAGPQEITGVLDQLKNMRHDRYFAFPEWVKVASLEVGESSGVEETLKYLTVAQATAAGLPLALALGSGEATNRSTLNNQQQMLEIVLEYMGKKIASDFTRFILAKIAQVNKWSEVPTMVWGDVRAEEKNDKAKRLVDYVSSGILAPQEATDYAKTSEDLR